MSAHVMSSRVAVARASGPAKNVLCSPATRGRPLMYLSSVVSLTLSLLLPVTLLSCRPNNTKVSQEVKSSASLFKPGLRSDNSNI
jgi:hypothetical protein